MSSKLKYSVGYQLPDLYPFSDVIKDYSKDIHEVYFPWLDVPDGRGSSIIIKGEQEQMEKELANIHDWGINLNLLWNANCYGDKAISREMEQHLVTVIRRLLDHIGLEVVTTTSLFAAHIVQKQFPSLDVRASVNMGIGTISGMKYVKDYFDSFYIDRALNRFPAQIRSLRNWCDAHEKKLYLLANSGCLKNCSAHTFHDNLVAHERGLSQQNNSWNRFLGICWDYYALSGNHYSFIYDSTWIRPEDIDRYIGVVDGIKLATRSHRNPARVITSYILRKYEGNILALCEPDFSSLCILENSRFPADWMDKLETFSEAEQEQYCKEVFNCVNC
jgi:collagenase-like PrtC family protease